MTKIVTVVHEGYLVADARVSNFRPEGGDCVSVVIPYVVPPAKCYDVVVRPIAAYRGDLIALRINDEGVRRSHHTVVCLDHCYLCCGRGRASGAVFSCPRTPRPSGLFFGQCHFRFFFSSYHVVDDVGFASVGEGWIPPAVDVDRRPCSYRANVSFAVWCAPTAPDRGDEMDTDVHFRVDFATG